MPFIIDDSTGTDVLHPPGKGHGYDPTQVVKGVFAPPAQLQLIPRSEWSARIKERKRLKSGLRDVRDTGNGGSPIPSLDQGQVGYCWAHSVTNTVQLQRAAVNQPYVPLSAYAIAATIKKGRDEGGWCGLSAEFARDKGIPSQALWPQGDRNYRAHDTAEVWADAARHRITEDWVDLTSQVYDQTLTFDQLVTCLLTNVPVAVDFNWWSHSVCAVDVDEVSSGSFGIWIWNSWGDGWGQNGMGLLQGQRAIPDGAVATRVSIGG